MDIFLIPQNAPFAISTLIFLGLLAIEILLLVFGASFSGTIDDMLPDLDLDGTEFSVGKAFAFVGVGKVPTLVLLMLLSLVFGLGGVGLQAAFQEAFEVVAPTWLAVAVVLPLSLVVTGQTARLLAAIMPDVQTSAIAEASLVGRGATIAYGNATHELPASAEVRDEHGKLHHVQIKSDREGEVLSEGQIVFITRLAEGFYFASPDNHIN